MTTSDPGNTCVWEEPAEDVLETFLFQNNQAIRSAHNAPRFGHANDLAVLFTGTSDEKSDYLTGLVASSIFLFVIFLCWMLVLLFFKYRGPERYGWLSGQHQPLPLKPVQDEKLSETVKGDQGDDTLPKSRSIIAF